MSKYNIDDLRAAAWAIELKGVKKNVLADSLIIAILIYLFGISFDGNSDVIPLLMSILPVVSISCLLTGFYFYFTGSFLVFKAMINFIIFSICLSLYPLFWIIIYILISDFSNDPLPQLPYYNPALPLIIFLISTILYISREKILGIFERYRNVKSSGLAKEYITEVINYLRVADHKTEPERIELHGENENFLENYSIKMTENYLFFYRKTTKTLRVYKINEFDLEYIEDQIYPSNKLRVTFDLSYKNLSRQKSFAWITSENYEKYKTIKRQLSNKDMSFKR